MKKDHGASCYWVVSPNVRNKETQVGDWRQASVKGRVAFMGWPHNDPGHHQMGPKFAGATDGGIEPGDVILIARRHHSGVELVGFGVVTGKAIKHLAGAPAKFGSARHLRPFMPWSGLPPQNIPIIAVLRHTMALAKLHPGRNDAHRKVCKWMDKLLQEGSAYGKRNRAAATTKRRSILPKVRIVDSPKAHQLDYKVQTKATVVHAKKVEAQLVQSYKELLARQGRALSAARYNMLQCDGYERKRKNLIEAKSSSRREHIRMAVGQLLDYAFQGAREFGEPHKAILVPSKPEPEIEAWLDSLKIKIVWQEKGAFLDNANGQFT